MAWVTLKGKGEAERRWKEVSKKDEPDVEDVRVVERTWVVGDPDVHQQILGQPADGVQGADQQNHWDQLNQFDGDEPHFNMSSLLSAHLLHRLLALLVHIHVDCAMRTFAPN